MRQNLAILACADAVVASLEDLARLLAPTEGRRDRVAS
jgi:hypothetical protein